MHGQLSVHSVTIIVHPKWVEMVLSSLLFCKEHLYEGLSHCFEGVFVKVCHIVVYGMPGRAKRAFQAVGIIGYDIDGGDARLLVHWYMVVGDLAAQLEGEVVAVSRITCRLPHFVNH